MAKKQTNASATSANIATAAAAALQKEKAILSTKRSPAAKKHAKAQVADVFVESVLTEKPAEQAVFIEETVIVQASPIASNKPASSRAKPSRAKIAELAYLYWEARGGQGGHQEEKQDWLRAEAELTS